MGCKLAEPAKLQTVLLPKPPGIHDELVNKQQESANQPCCASINQSINQHSGAALRCGDHNSMLQIGVGRHIRCRMKGERTPGSLRMGRGARLCNPNCSNLAAQGLGFQGFDFFVGRGCLDQSGELQRRHINPLPGTHCPQGLRQQLTCFVPGETTPQQRLHKQAGPMTGRAC
jgi:hypothetical protein